MDFDSIIMEAFDRFGDDVALTNEDTIQLDLKTSKLDQSYCKAFAISHDNPFQILIHRMYGTGSHAQYHLTLRCREQGTAFLILNRLLQEFAKRMELHQIKGNWIVKIYDMMTSTLHNLGSLCVICQEPLVFHMAKFMCCNSPTCVFAYQHMSLYDSLEDLYNCPKVVELVICAAGAAAQNAARKTHLFEGLPTEFLNESLEIDWTVLQCALDETPSMEAMLQAQNLRDVLTTQQYVLLRWLLRTNKATISVVAPEDQFFSPVQSCNFICRLTTIQKRYSFERVKLSEGSFYAFHGSPLCNWHAILRNGLKNCSKTPLMSSGAVYGDGIYLSTSLNESITYTGQLYGTSTQTTWKNASFDKPCCVAICEVIGKPLSTRTIQVVPDVSRVRVRFVLLFTGPRSYGISFNSMELKNNKYIQQCEEKRSKTAATWVSVSQTEFVDASSRHCIKEHRCVL